MNPQPNGGLSNASLGDSNPTQVLENDDAVGDGETYRDVNEKNTPHALVDFPEEAPTTIPEIAQRFLCLANLDSGAFERLNRYETALWRQVGQNNPYT